MLREAAEGDEQNGQVQRLPDRGELQMAAAVAD